MGYWPGQLILCVLSRLGVAHCLCTWDGWDGSGLCVLGGHPCLLGHSRRQRPSPCHLASAPGEPRIRECHVAHRQLSDSLHSIF